MIGYALAVPLTWTSDRLAAYLTKRNGGIREAEMRLGVLIPAAIIAPCGLILYGYTAQRNLAWVGYFAGVAMCDWGSYFFFTFTLAYAIDSCKFELDMTAFNPKLTDFCSQTLLIHPKC